MILGALPPNPRLENLPANDCGMKRRDGIEKVKVKSFGKRDKSFTVEPKPGFAVCASKR